MHIIHHYISEALMYALGWTVVHTLWQTAGIALLLAGVLPLLQKKSAIIRYWLAYAALVLVFGLAVATFLDLYASARAFSVVEITRLTIPDAPHASIADTPALLQRWQQYFDKHLPMLVSLWLLGVAFFVLRLLSGLVYLKRLKTAHTSLVDTHWEELLAYLAQRMAVQRPVMLLESALVQTPVVLGHLKPLILLPVGMVNTLSIAQVEAILAHELAHIARHDYLLNVLQSFIEALLYFNPAVWWLSAIIRAEREHCCDDRALQVCDNSFAYAKALVAIQEMHRPAPGLAMAFGHQKNHLLYRIQRILQQPQNRTNIMEKITATCLLLAAIIGLSINATWPHAQHAPAPDLVVLDTVPKQSTMRYNGKRSTQRVELKVENDKITYLKVDGREIPAEEYPKYQSLVEDIMGDMPLPPLAPERPKAPGAVPTPPAPPAPPTPPAPPAPKKQGAVLYWTDDAYDAEEIAALRAQAKEMQQQAQVIAEEARRLYGADVQLLRETAEQRRAEAEQHRIAAEQLRAQTLMAQEKIEAALLQEGLIKHLDDYRLELLDDRVLLNGKALLEEHAERYRQLHQDMSKLRSLNGRIVIEGRPKLE